MNAQDTPPPAGPAPGPELNIGGTGTTNFGGLAPETMSKLNKLAGVVEEAGKPAQAAPAPAPAPKPTKAEPQAAPAPAKAVEPKPEPAKAAEPAKPEGAQTPKQLREAYERAQARASEMETSLSATAKEKAEAYARLAAAEEKLTSYEKRIAEEFEPMRKVLDERSKRLTEVEENLRMRDYTATQEWHEKYVQPITAVQQEVGDVLAQLGVQEGETMRQATPQDFAKVLSAPTLNEAERVAKALFGEGFATTELVRHSAKLRQLSKAQQTALQNAKLESEKWHQTQQQQQTEMQARLRAFVQQQEAKHGAELATLAADPELKEALDAGNSLADTLVNGDPKLTHEGWADVVARSRVAIKRDAVNQKRIARLEADLKAKEAELARYKASEPSVETRNAGAAAPEPEEGSSYWANLPGKLLKHAQAKR